MGRTPLPLSALARAALAAERERPAEDEALKQRLLERAREAVAPDRPSGVALRSAAISGSPRRRKLASRALVLIAAMLGVAGLAAAGASLYRLTAAAAPAPVSLPAAAPPLPAPPVAPVAETAGVAAEPQAPVAVPEAPRAVAPAESAQPTSVQQYAVELGVLEPARRSIARGDYAGAMAAIARHQREYPRGQPAEEREALRVRALWGTGQKASAERAAAAFRKRYPRSVLLSWMKDPVKQSR
jgi:hypothetical protein